MAYFQTLDGAVYYIDTVNQTITGGIFGRLLYGYIQLRVIKGRKAMVQLEDGRVIKTSYEVIAIS